MKVPRGAGQEQVRVIAEGSAFHVTFGICLSSIISVKDSDGLTDICDHIQTFYIGAGDKTQVLRSAQ